MKQKKEFGYKTLHGGAIPVLRVVTRCHKKEVTGKLNPCQSTLIFIRIVYTATLKKVFDSTLKEFICDCNIHFHIPIIKILL